MHSLLLHIAQYSYWGIFFSLGLGILGLPIPDETLMAFVGFQVFQGKLNYSLAITVAFIGTSCGITLGYFIGRLSDKLFLKKYSEKIHITPERFRSAEQFYNRYGKLALCIGYFIPGVRHLTAILAGVSHMPYRTFALFAYAGGFLWTVIFINMGYLLGDSWHRFSGYSNRFIIPLAATALVVALFAMYFKPNNGK
jgi:membrane protein DedA with SNARE-associated domain